MTEELIENKKTGEFYAGTDKGIVFWSEWPKKNNFVRPWVYGGKVPPTNDLARLRKQGFKVRAVPKLNNHGGR